MRRLRIVIGVVILACAWGGLATSQSALAAGNSDAAHACQGDGYLSLKESDGVTGFKNPGECVSYAAHGGQFSQGLPSCTVTATTGCLTFDNQQLTNEQGDTVTVSGVFAFDSSCSNDCSYSLPNDQATGAGTYTETDSSGTTIASGTLTVADANGEGLAIIRTGGSACSASSGVLIAISAAAVSGQSVTSAGLLVQTGATPYSEIGIGINPTFVGTTDNVTLSC